MAASTEVNPLPPSAVRETASSTASRPKSVVNLMIGFIATDEVSLNGSPTVSPTTVAACSSVPFSFRSTSTSFLALSPAPPAVAGVGKEDRREQAEQRDRDQVADKEERLQAGERQRAEEHRQEDVEHPL